MSELVRAARAQTLGPKEHVISTMKIWHLQSYTDGQSVPGFTVRHEKETKKAEREGKRKEATQPQVALQLFSSPFHKKENKNNKECQWEDCFWCPVY